MKVKYREPNNNYWFQHWWNYFCNQSCLMEFVNHNIQGMIALAPRREPLETPIKDPKKETHNNGYYSYNNWNIEKKEVDNNNG